MKTLLTSLALVVSGCAAHAPVLPAGHPADHAAPTGRLAGPPAILRGARTAVPVETTPPPEHHHE